MIAVLLAIAWMLPESAFHAKQLLPASMNTLDDSWHLELGWRLSRGELVGRDGVFTYGPLFQLVHGGPALFFGGAIAPPRRPVDFRSRRTGAVRRRVGAVYGRVWGR